jgi:hypothetical protein
MRGLLSVLYGVAANLASLAALLHFVTVRVNGHGETSRRFTR